MSSTERKATLQAARSLWPGTLMNNVSSCCLTEALDLLQHSHGLVSTSEVRGMHGYRAQS